LILALNLIPDPIERHIEIELELESRWIREKGSYSSHPSTPNLCPSRSSPEPEILVPVPVLIRNLVSQSRYYAHCILVHRIAVVAAVDGLRSIFEMGKDTGRTRTPVDSSRSRSR
jgi:hypothetical protein